MILSTNTCKSQERVFRCFFLTLLLFIGFLSSEAQKAVYKEFYYPDSTISSKGYFVDGKPDGYWSNYHPNGQLKSIGKRTTHKLDSIWKFFDPQGNLITEIHYLNGKKNGYYSTFEVLKIADSSVSVLKHKELYLNNIKEGKSLYYHFTGYLEESIPFRYGKKHGTAFQFDSLGTTISYSVYQNGILLSHQMINKTDSTGTKVGIWKEFHTNGTVKEETVYRNGTLSGYHKRFNRNGQILSAQLYQGDSLIADSITDLSFADPVEYVTYFANEKPRTRGQFIDSIPVGIHRVYDSLGNVIASTVYSDKGQLISKGIITDKGVKQGKWIYYFSNGNIKQEGVYKHGKERGTWKYYYANGIVRETGSFQDGLYTDMWSFYYENGELLRQSEYFNGKPEGLSTEYSDSATVVSEGMYLDGLRDGVWKIHTGTIKQVGSYRSGDKVGEWVYTYNTGNKRFIGSYRLGKEHGKHLYYYEDGTLEREEVWKNAKADKIWKYYRPNGTLALMKFYKRGKERRIIHVDEDE